MTHDHPALVMTPDTRHVSHPNRGLDMVARTTDLQCGEVPSVELIVHISQNYRAFPNTS